MTVFMVTHDIAEAFRLGTRLIVFDRARADGDDGSTITYDLPLKRARQRGDDLAAAAVSAAATLDKSVSIITQEQRAKGGNDRES
jgi:NitT/TauT family transport system ATP-binding protein